MPRLFDLTIVAPDRAVLEGRAESLVAPGVEGYFGVLFGHAPMIVQLRPGELKLMDDQGRTRYLAISGGFLEVSPLGQVAVVADAAEAAEEIDVARAQAAAARARERMASRNAGLDVARAQAALQRALIRLRVAGRTG